jgi:spoIIIJ-associated protein
MDENSTSIEVSARSVDEAVLKALQELGLSHDEVEVEVVKQGSRGLLGLLSEDAVVRVTPKVPASVEEAPAPSVVTDQHELAQIGIEVLQNLVNYMGLRARVVRESAPLESQTGSDPVLLNVSGEDLGVLIGRRGETLRDLQFLTCLVISRHIQSWPNLIVDVEHYRSRREKSLIDLARRMADRVRTTAESVSLEPMPPHERRIVHLTLRDDPDVFTESVGQAEERKVVIMPKK